MSTIRKDAGQADAEREVLAHHVVRAASGDRHAMTRVWQLTSGKLNALLIRMLRDPVVAEEVLQEVYLTVWRRGSTFDPARASPVTWLVTIARNKAIDRLRVERARGTAPLPIDEVEVADQGPSVVRLLERTEQEARLFVCLDGLDVKQQAAIRGAFFDGLTYEALAAREGVPLGTMKSWIRRGLLRLRACLDG